MRPEACPWADFRPTHIAFCEERLCAWIREPANTWSNLSYLVVGAWLVARAVRERRPRLVAIGATELFVFVGSFLFHASSTFVGEVLDVSAMMLFAWLMLSQNAARLLAWTSARTNLVFVVGSLVSCALLVAVRDVGIPLFAVTVVVAFGIEMRSVRRYGRLRAHRELAALVLTFGVAWGFWWLDLLRVAPVCDPERHWFTGHAVWHLVNALCFVFLFRFQAQASDAAPPARPLGASKPA